MRRTLAACAVLVVFAAAGGTTQCRAQGHVELTRAAPELARGNLAIELVSGAATAALGGWMAYSMGGQVSHCAGADVPQPCQYGSPIARGLVFGAVLPALTIGGVLMAGSASGGDGDLGATTLVAYTVGGVAMLVGGGLASAFGEKIRSERELVPFWSAGLFAGSLLGYRFSARKRVSIAMLPSFREPSAMLSVNGVM